MRQVKSREVKGVISSEVVTRWMIPDTSDMPIEVRQRRDGSYSLHYPAEGWLPCVPGCDARHSHEYTHPYTESYYQPRDLDEAIVYAELLAGLLRDVKIIEWVPPSQRPRRKKGDTDA